MDDAYSKEYWIFEDATIQPDAARHPRADPKGTFHETARAGKDRIHQADQRTQVTKGYTLGVDRKRKGCPADSFEIHGVWIKVARRQGL